MGKEKKEKRRSEAADEDEGKVDKVPWEDKIRFLSPISQPLASKKLARKLYKVAKKGNLARGFEHDLHSVGPEVYGICACTFF